MTAEEQKLNRVALQTFYNNNSATRTIKDQEMYQSNVI